jgi:hypothetical protein
LPNRISDVLETALVFLESFATSGGCNSFERTKWVAVVVKMNAITDLREFSAVLQV